VEFLMLLLAIMVYAITIITLLLFDPMTFLMYRRENENMLTVLISIITIKHHTEKWYVLRPRHFKYTLR